MAVSAQSLQAIQSKALAARHKSKPRPIPNLKCRGFRREPKRKFTVYCEGKNTEPLYFESIERHCKSRLIRVETVARGDVPYVVVKKAVSRTKSEGLVPRRRRKRNSFEKKDEVWPCLIVMIIRVLKKQLCSAKKRH